SFPRSGNRPEPRARGDSPAIFLCTVQQPAAIRLGTNIVFVDRRSSGPCLGPRITIEGHVMSNSGLDELQVSSPCQASWEQMTGDNRVRFCAQCKQNVYNLSDLTHTEAVSLVREHEGKLCVRFFRRPDGSFLTRDCRPRKRWPVVQLLAMVIGCFLLVLAAL